MPKKGYESITIRTDIFNIAKKDAKSETRSPGNYLQHLIVQEHELKKKLAKLRSQL